MILIKGDIFHRITSLPVELEFVIIFMVYLLAYGRETGAGIFVLCQGLYMDLLSGGVWGFHAILYLAVYLTIKIISRPFDQFSVFGQVVLVFIAVLLRECLGIPLLHVFSLEGSISPSGFAVFVISALLSGLAAPLVFYLFNALGRLFFGSREELSGTV